MENAVNQLNLNANFRIPSMSGFDNHRHNDCMNVDNYDRYSKVNFNE